MSGGAFNYNQYNISEIIDRIEQEIEYAAGERPEKIHYTGSIIYKIDNNCRKFIKSYDNIDKEEALRTFIKSRNINYYEKNEKNNEIRIKLPVLDDEFLITEFDYWDYPDYGYYPEYNADTIQEFRNAIDILKKAVVYANRIDWLISGDDGEDDFHKCLKEELNKIKNV